MIPMKKTFIRALSFFLTLTLFTTALLPGAAAVEYPGIEPVTLEATASLLVDMDTGQVLHEVNADEMRYPASITKVMTALLVVEAVARGELSMDTVITVDAAALTDITDDSSTANIVAGEEITIQNLLYCLMVVSANEAANILAMAVSGDIPTFVELMNTRAQELGMEGTHFVNPHGLHNDDHYSTARDIYTMSKEAMTHATFRELVSTDTYTVPATNKSAERTLYNTNGLLTRFKYYGYVYPGTIGIKTGSTPEAGYCLVSAATRKGTTLCAVVLGCENPETGPNKVDRKQFTQSAKLLDWGYDNFSTATLLDADTYLEEMPVKFSADSSHVVVHPAESVRTLIPGQFDEAKLDLRLNMDSKNAIAPISAGQALGTVSVIYDGQEYAQVDMVAVNDVPFSPFMAFVHSVNAVFGNLFVQILLILAAILFLVGFVRRVVIQKAKEQKEARKAKQELKRQQAEARRIQEELEYDQQHHARDLRRQEQNRIRQEEQERRRQAQEVRRAEQARLREEQELRRQEQRRIQEEERRRRQEARQREEEERRRQREARRREEEERRRIQEARRREEEAMRRQQEARRRQELERRREEARRREAEERRWREQTRQAFQDDRRYDNRDRYHQRDRRPTSRDDRRGSDPYQNRRDHKPNNRR